MRRHRLAVLLHHPIHYHAPLMRRLAADPDLEVQVYFCFDHGVRRRRDEEFGVEYTWDIPLLDGYAHAFLRNWSPRPSTAPIAGVFNPGIWGRIRKGNFDAVIVHGYVSPTVWIAILAAWASGTPVLMRGESTLLYDQSAWMRVVKRLVLRALFSAVASFLYIGTRNREFYESFGIVRERFSFVPYSVDNDSFFRAQADDGDLRTRTRASLGVADGEPVVLFAGKLIERKRPMDLLRAYSAVVADHPDTHLVFVGEGAARPEVEAFVRAHELRRVHVVGFQNRRAIAAYYACADLFVLPSHHDPWGLVVNEAMCFGLPVIATTLVGCAPDLIAHGENGFVYPAGDVQALTVYLRVLVSDAPRRARMGHLSRDRIGRWSFAECVDGIKAAIRAAQRSGTLTGETVRRGEQP